MTVGRSYPPLPPDLRPGLERVEPSTDGVCEYRPCRVTLIDGDVRDFVYLVEASRYIDVWGFWPEDDPDKRSLPVEQVAALHDSPFRLPAELANRLYTAGESGMGYTVFTVVLADGRQLPFVTGNAVDFPSLPAEVTSADVVDVLPHVGSPAFRDRAPSPSESAADYAWCLYQG